MKKIISILSAICIIASSIACSFSAIAQNQAQVYVSVFNTEYMMAPTKLTVDAGLSTTYKDVVGYDDNSENPTILDAFIAAHLEFMGEVDGLLSVSSSGWLETVFSMDANLSYYLNGVTPQSNLNEEVKSNDYLDICFYQDLVGWSDAYANFDKRSVTVEQGDTLELKITASGFDSSWKPVNIDCKDLDVLIDGNPSQYKVLNNNIISITCDELKDFSVSTSSTLGSKYFFAPYCEVKVVEKETTTTPTTQETTTTTPTTQKTTTTTTPTTQETTAAPIPLNTNKPSLEEVSKTLAAAGDYLTNGVDKFQLENSFDFICVVMSGANVDGFADEYAQSVKENLDANNGKIIVYGAESIGSYGATIQILSKLGYDVTDFYGYDLVKAFSSMDPTVADPSLYSYRYAIEAAAMLSLDDFAKELCETMIKAFYTTGSGANYYGYSCDNTCALITSLSYYKADFADTIEDALKVLSTYKTQDGYFYNAEYSTQANGNSTAAALMAYASVGEKDLATDAYNSLMKLNKNGAFEYLAGTGENQLATRDSITALYYYSQLVEADRFNDSNQEAVTQKEATTQSPATQKVTTTKEATTDINEEEATESAHLALDKNTSKKSPATGLTGAIGFSLLSAAAVTLLAKKRSK